MDPLPYSLPLRPLQSSRNSQTDSDSDLIECTPRVKRGEKWGKLGSFTTFPSSPSGITVMDGIYLEV